MSTTFRTAVAVLALGLATSLGSPADAEGTNGRGKRKSTNAMMRLGGPVNGTALRVRDTNYGEYGSLGGSSRGPLFIGVPVGQFFQRRSLSRGPG